MHSPSGPTIPQQPSVCYVPKDLLAGLEASLDNPSKARLLNSGKSNSLQIPEMCASSASSERIPTPQLISHPPYPLSRANHHPQPPLKLLSPPISLEGSVSSTRIQISSYGAQSTSPPCSRPRSLKALPACLMGNANSTPLSSRRPNLRLFIGS